jgi:hypothetical protein
MRHQNKSGRILELENELMLSSGREQQLRDDLDSVLAELGVSRETVAKLREQIDLQAEQASADNAVMREVSERERDRDRDDRNGY